MIKFETINSIDDAEFDILFEASLSSLDAGAYPWHLYPDMDTVEQKKEHIRLGFQKFLTEGFVWRVFDDNGVLTLNAGVKEGDRATFLLGLVKPNNSGTKSYFYTDEFNNARNAYWVELGITGWTVETTGKDTPIYNHFNNRKEASKLGSNMTEKIVVIRDSTIVEPINLNLVQ